MPRTPDTHLQRLRRSPARQAMEQARRASQDRQRRDSRAFYWSTDWRKFRAAFLAAHPVCIICSRAVATEVDHIQTVRDRPDLAFDEANCRALCKPCHSSRTARDQGWGHRKGGGDT